MNRAFIKFSLILSLWLILSSPIFAAQDSATARFNLGVQVFLANAGEELVKAIASTWAYDYLSLPSAEIVTVGHNWSHGSINNAHSNRLEDCQRLVSEHERKVLQAMRTAIVNLAGAVTNEVPRYSDTNEEVVRFFTEWASKGR